jgi:hypothetical protein
MAELIVGGLGKVTVRITAIDEPSQTCTVRVVDSNFDPITPNATIPIGNVEGISITVAIGDVLENLKNGATAVVRFVDTNDATIWSEMESGANPRRTENWTKLGTFTIPA